MRKEHDLLGELNIPKNAYYGIQTFRSTENFKITDFTPNRPQRRQITNWAI